MRARQRDSRTVGDNVGVTTREVPEKLPRGRAAPRREVVVASQRRRLLAAVGEIAGTKGLVELTVSDLIAEAGVGRNTFYELFADKDDCYLQAFAANRNFLLLGARQATEAADGPLRALADGLRAYLAILDAQPVLARAFLFESMRGGPAIVAARREAQLALQDLLRETYDRLHRTRPDLTEPPVHAFLALTAGINELVYHELERGAKAAAISRLEPHVLWLAGAILGLGDELGAAH